MTFRLGFSALLFFVSSLSWAEELRFVLDLDHVLWHKIEPSKTASIPESELLRHGDWAYRVRDGAREFIEALSRRGKVTFFSAGPEPRNLSLLSQLKMSDGRTRAIDLAQGRVFSEHHLTSNQSKDLLKAVKKTELPFTLLIDDTATNALPSQARNLLWARNNWSKDGFVEKFTQAAPNLSRDEATRLASEFTADRNKLVRLYGLIDEAASEAERTGRPLLEVIDNLKSQLGTDPASEMRFYRRGARGFKSVNPHYRFTSLLPAFTRIECVRNQLLIRR